jgi:putative transposase
MKKGARKTEAKKDGMLPRRQLTLTAMLVTLRRGLREFVVEAGMQALEGLLEDERTMVCGPRYRHDENRRAVRGGHARGELVMGGRRVSVRRPRARSSDGKREVPLDVWQQFSGEDALRDDAVEKMVVGVSTRKYRRVLDEVPAEIETRGTSKSAVSRRFVAATAERLDEWLKRPLGELRLAAVYIDGIVFDEHTVLIALGVDVEGKKHVLGIHQGATENATACGGLVDDLIERGVRPDRSLLFVVDGSKALVKAVRTRFGHRALIQRCQVHKARNVKEHLPKEMHASVAATMRQAYASREHATAKRQLENLARRLEEEHPSAAASVREGLAETLTVIRLKLTGAFERTLATTNPVENLNSTARWTCRNVKRWRGGTMVLRWACAAMEEASHRFRRIKGARAGMTSLLLALRENDRIIDIGHSNNIDVVSNVG